MSTSSERRGLDRLRDALANKGETRQDMLEEALAHRERTKEAPIKTPPPHLDIDMIDRKDLDG